MASPHQPADRPDGPPMLRRSRRLDAINGLVLLTLLGGVFVGNYVIDPFRLNGRFALEFDRQAVCEKLSYQHWKMAAFLHSPAPVVILGDSRADHLPVDVFSAALDRPVFNFAFGGGSATDVIDAFWFAAHHTRLERVYIGLNFTMVNAHQQQHHAREADELIANPLRYYLSPFITQATAKLVLHRLAGVAFEPQQPPMDREAFWRFQLEVTARRSYAGFQYAPELRGELDKVANYCREHGIELAFIVFPTHADLQRKVAEFGLEAEYARFKRDLGALGEVFDYETDNALTRDPDNFTDPFHPGPTLSRRIAEEVAGQRGDAGSRRDPRGVDERL